MKKIEKTYPNLTIYTFQYKYYFGHTQICFEEIE